MSILWVQTRILLSLISIILALSRHKLELQINILWQKNNILWAKIILWPQISIIPIGMFAGTI